MKIMNLSIFSALKSIDLRVPISKVLSNKFFYFAIIFQLIIFWPIITDEIINDHLWPLGMFHPFPTHLFEGRWFLELIHLLNGSQGNQKIQIILAIILKACNILIIFKLFGAKQNSVSILAGLAYLIFPTVLDQYSFYTATTFTVVETFTLFGYYFLYIKSSRIIAIVCFTLSFAIYQPIIALILLMPLLIQLFELITIPTFNLMFFKNTIICIFLSAVLSQIPNFFIYKYLIHTPRFSGFDWSVMYSQIRFTPVYVYRFFRYCFYTNTNIILEYIPLCIFLCFCFLSFFKSKNKFLSFSILILLPFVLQSVFILSSGKAEYEGRSHYIYSFIFLISAMFLLKLIQEKYTNFMALPFLVIFIFFSINTQQITNYLTYKNIYDKNYVNRIVARIEPLLNSNKKYKLVIFGTIPQFWVANQIRYTNYLPHYTRSFFQPYRQVQILNYWLGYDILTYPDDIDIQKAEVAVIELQTYPQQNFAIVKDDILVVKLSNTKERTWTNHYFNEWFK